MEQKETLLEVINKTERTISETVSNSGLPGEVLLLLIRNVESNITNAILQNYKDQTEEKHEEP